MATIVEGRTLPAVESTANGTPANAFYRAVWRWHFYAGIFVIPFMLMLAITGSIYLFRQQLDRLMYPQTVQPRGTALSPTQQLAAVEAAYPNATVNAFKPAPASDRSAEVTITSGERDLTVFVDPYTAEVLGERDDANNLQYYAVTLHSELMIGTVGDRLIELAACWGIVLTITGLFLWWPRKGSRVWGVLLPRFQRHNKRLLWRDLHAVPGFWGAALVLFMLLTGLPWTGFWGDQFASVWSRFPAAMWDDVPVSTEVTGSLNQNGNTIVPWAAEQVPTPQSNTEHANHGGSGTTTTAAAPLGAVTLDTVVATAQERGVVPGYSVSVPQDAEGVYTVSVFPNDPAQEASLHIDQYSGAVLADVRWQQYGLVPKAVELGISLHEGRYFGLANQLLMLGVCMLIVLLSTTGVAMWWQRRPRTWSIGAPAMPAMPVWKGAVAIMVVLGIAFPLMGASLAAVLLLDYLVIRRVPVLRRMWA